MFFFKQKKNDEKTEIKNKIILLYNRNEDIKKMVKEINSNLDVYHKEFSHQSIIHVLNQYEVELVRNTSELKLLNLKYSK